MIKHILIIGGYGNFGTFISKKLGQEPDLKITIAGRSEEKAKVLADEIGAEYAVLDIAKDLDQKLPSINPYIVVHTSGPFQGQGYDVAKACLKIGAHYIDLADGREFVEGIETLNDEAEKAKTLIVSGASSVPCLTSALVDYYKDQFKTIEELDYGITTAQKTARGLATTAAILSYTGKPFKTKIEGKENDIYGWQGLRCRKYPELGRRLLGNCSVPDLALFPKLYPEIETIRFYAGLEIPFIHVTLWTLSWLVRARLVKSLEPLAPTLLKLSFLFDWLGTANSAFHMELKGQDKEGNPKQITFELTARSGDGPYIPCMPSIILAKKLARGEISQTGATPCIGLITKDEYLDALADMDIKWKEL